MPISPAPSGLHSGSLIGLKCYFYFIVSAHAWPKFFAQVSQIKFHNDWFIIESLWYKPDIHLCPRVLWASITLGKISLGLRPRLIFPRVIHAHNTLAQGRYPILMVNLHVLKRSCSPSLPRRANMHVCTMCFVWCFVITILYIPYRGKFSPLKFFRRWQYPTKI